VQLLPVRTMAVDDAAVRDMQRRLQVLEDREEIRALLIEYGRTLDARDFRAFSELFARDGGTWDGGMGVAQGPEAIRKLMEETIGRNTGGVSSPNYHLFDNAVITVDGDQAAAVTKWSFVVQGEDNRPQWVYLGHYHDTFIKEDGRWKFLLRKVTGAIPGDQKNE
jgi:ketosteroid isomerase-like protein